MHTEAILAAKPKLTFEQEVAMIRGAPIMEVAAYFGGDLELAVQLRVDQAVSETHDKLAARRGLAVGDPRVGLALRQSFSDMEITVKPIVPQGNLRGFASVAVNGIRIDDFKIVESKDGKLFVGMPSKPDRSSDTGYRNTVHIERGYKAAFDDAVVRQYYAAAKQAQSLGHPASRGAGSPAKVDNRPQGAR